jgi:hypothetical protein
MDSYNMTSHKSSPSNRPGRWLGALLAVALTCISPVARAGLVPVPVTPNDSFSSAQDVDPYFTIEDNSYIAKSTEFPHVTIVRTGDGTFDYFSFTISDINDDAIFDIDFGDETGAKPTDADIFLRLYRPDGMLIFSRDEGGIGEGELGSDTEFDPYFEVPNLTLTAWPSIGVFRIEVAAIDEDTQAVIPVPADKTYILQISIDNDSTSAAAIPEPSIVTFLGLGAFTGLGCGWRRRRRRDLKLAS